MERMIGGGKAWLIWGVGEDRAIYFAQKTGGRGQGGPQWWGLGCILDVEFAVGAI